MIRRERTVALGLKETGDKWYVTERHDGERVSTPVGLALDTLREAELAMRERARRYREDGYRTYYVAGYPI